MKETYHYRLAEASGSRRRLILQSLGVTLAIFFILPALETMVRKTPELKVRKIETTEFRLKPPAPPRQEQKKKPMRKPQMREIKANMPLPVDPSMKLDLGTSAGDFAINVDFNAELDPQDLIFESEDVDRPPMARAQIQPVYPYSARSKGIEGHVTLRFIVEASGVVRKDSMEVVEQQPQHIFNDAAAKAVKQWTFEPGTMQGEPVPVWVRVTIHFKLDE